MPRQARRKSKSGMYHVIFRGVNKQEIFHDAEDCIRFLEILKKCKENDKILLMGWCLMNNHVHLLVKEGSEDLSNSMKSLGIRYAWYHHKKYESTGHLFQDRFRSVNVETDRSLCTVIRYIHQNPVKAGLATCPADWKWSSYNAYCGNRGDPNGLLNGEKVLEVFSENLKQGLEGFKEFHEVLPETEDCLLEGMNPPKLSDEEALGKLKAALMIHSIDTIKSLPKTRRDPIIRNMKDLGVASQRQLARILGMSQSMIAKIR